MDFMFPFTNQCLGTSFLDEWNTLCGHEPSMKAVSYQSNDVSQKTSQTQTLIHYKHEVNLSVQDKFNLNYVWHKKCF